MLKSIKCKNCNNYRLPDRGLCQECHNKQKAEAQKRRLQKILPKGNCIKCQREITLFNNNQKYCRECYLIERKAELFQQIKENKHAFLKKSADNLDYSI
jgi:hypothetical protein